ncbi:hypothetical protein SASPL_148628 [Salvia splendens]|uniref:Uncharacterized protein n=1 Tax=Salvia splendens TaxID=180675 RepID=A0A8X8Z4A0_SALSN|nr:hypothetical protein SASPL_148628 [Salvia splendens]
MSLMLPTAKRYLELKYNEMHKLVSNRQVDGSIDEVGEKVLAPISRCFTALTIKVAETEQKSFIDELKVDKYWTSKLVEWRDTSLPFRVPNRLCKKLFCDVLRFVLNFCIVFQILFVLAGKLLLFLFAIYARGFYSVFCKNSRVGGPQGSRDGAQLDFSQYALLLEGEPQLPGYIVKNICNEVDRLIKKGEENQSTNLIRLLKASSNFNGVGLFDSNQVPSLHSQEPPNCWALPIVTLTTITVALTNIADDKANQLLASVREGLSIVGVEVYRKWDYKDLDSTSFRGATHRETLRNLSIVAEKIVTEFMAQTRDVLMQNPLNWPVRVIAANSMYRIAQTILLWMPNGEHQSDDELLEGISITISDIIAACLTNLVQSKEILEILRPRLDVEKVATIDEWRASMALVIENPPKSSDDATIVG